MLDPFHEPKGSSLKPSPFPGSPRKQRKSEDAQPILRRNNNLREHLAAVSRQLFIPDGHNRFHWHKAVEELSRGMGPHNVPGNWVSAVQESQVTHSSRIRGYPR